MSINQLLLFVSLVVGLADGLHVGTNTAYAEWKLWKLRYNKVYQTVDEETVRKELWLKHYAVFTDHGADPARQFEMEMNEFSDQILPRSKLEITKTEVKNGGAGLFRFAPASWDWRDHGAVSPVITQGQVNDVVSIVATESVESYTKIKGGKLVDMSFIETKQCCVPEPILSLDVFTCLHKIGGLCSSSDYPSTATSCRNDSCTPVGNIKGGKQSASGDEEALRETVATMPVMAGIDAGHASFQLYTSGVYSEPDCSSTRLDHVVQIVGYGSQDGQDYWICKNSWGKHWGMDGYIWIARNKNNMCGIATAAFYPM